MTVLVDTSVWADHFRSNDGQLVALLDAGRVLSHPFVIGELALGNLRDRIATMEALRALPMADRARDEEVLHFVGEHGLAGRGIGLIDAHLLVSARLTPGASLWTRDKRLMAIAGELGIRYES